jgi:hypothetical protein
MQYVQQMSKNKRGRQTKVMSITVPIELIPTLRKLAVYANRSVSNYISSLIRREADTLKK